jgi:hypothetical protein
MENSVVVRSRNEGGQGVGEGSGGVGKGDFFLNYRISKIGLYESKSCSLHTVTCVRFPWLSNFSTATTMG